MIFITWFTGYHRLANAQKNLGQHEAAMATLRAGNQVDSGNSEILRLMSEV